jgi:hypothetical protein
MHLLREIIMGKSISKDNIKKILNKMPNINKSQYDFMLYVLVLFMSIKGRINFLQLGRYSNHGEQHFRNKFEKAFDFLSFNKELVLEHCSKHLTIAFDPSYISKSGKSTPGLGYFWSGCAGKAKWGLEIGGIAAIDIDNHTAFHLEAVQTKTSKTDSLLMTYAKTIVDRKEALHSISKYIVVDAYFSKESYVSEICKNNFHIVSRFRNDANLRYKYEGEQKTGRGRPKTLDGKIDYKNINQEKFSIIEDNEQCKIYHAIVNSKSLKRDVNLVIVYTCRNDKWTHKLYFCTDLSLSAEMVLKYYRTRFQIEFIYRDGKQFTGLNDCQVRSEKKLYFHFNTSLTAINIAKVSHWIKTPKEERKAFSMSSVKTMYYNELLIDRFFSMFGLSPNTSKNKRIAKKLRKYGAIAA